MLYLFNLEIKIIQFNNNFYFFIKQFLIYKNNYKLNNKFKD